MIDEYEYDMQDTELLIGTSRVNLTQGVVEAVKYTGWGDFTEKVAYQMD